MVSPYELRKGNCVLYHGKYGFVSQVLWNRLEIILDRNSNNYVECNYEEVEPVQVTPALLLKCGFRQHERFPHRDVFHIKDHHFIINQVRNSSEVTFGLDNNLGMVSKGDITLHRLQNLFFVLTGDELKIDLTNI